MNTGRIIRREVKYEFSGEEKRDNAQTLARLVQELAEADRTRKEIMAELKAKRQAIETRLLEASRWVHDGFDYREMDCRVVYHAPKHGMKEIYRCDTGELVGEAVMESDELQESLPFNDPPKEPIQ